MNTIFSAKLRGYTSKAKTLLVLACFFSILLAAACTPRVEVAAPDKPITINLNVKIDHEVRVKVEKDLEDEVFSDESDLF